MIADSKEVKEWELQINLQPDEIEAKVLKRPAILQYPSSGSQSPGSPTHVQSPGIKTLEDTNILRQIVC
jgi:hypothetical protein